MNVPGDHGAAQQGPAPHRATRSRSLTAGPEQRAGFLSFRAVSARPDGRPARAHGRAVLVARGARMGFVAGGAALDVAGLRPRPSALATTLRRSEQAGATIG